MAYLRRLAADLHAIRRRAAIDQEVGRHVDQALRETECDAEA
jgi:hypothetical protein